MFKIRLYQNEDGKSPISEFIYSANSSLQAKIAKQIKYLEMFGLTHSNPSLKKISGTPLWEIRILGKDNTRIICVAVIQNEVVILNIFNKKTNKTPPKELAISMKRYKSVLDK